MDPKGLMYGRIFDVPTTIQEVEAFLTTQRRGPGTRIGARWAKPGQNLPIWDGEEFNCRVTFQHQGPADRVRVQFTLTVGAQYPGRIGAWVALPQDAIWATYTVETGLVVCNGCAAIGEGRHLDGRAWLFSEALGQVWTDMVDNGFVTLRPAVAVEYNVRDAAYSVEVWSPRG